MEVDSGVVELLLEQGLLEPLVFLVILERGLLADVSERIEYFPTSVLAGPEVASNLIIVVLLPNLLETSLGEGASTLEMQLWSMSWLLFYFSRFSEKGG